MNNTDTMMFDFTNEKDFEVQQTIKIVYDALVDKGYNPINQIVGYIMSGDPSYITSHNNARGLIVKMERDELLEVVFKGYLESIK